MQIRRGAFLFANLKGINHSRGKDTTCARKDWFSASLKTNGDMALRMPEGLSRAKTQEMNNKTVHN